MIHHRTWSAHVASIALAVLVVAFGPIHWRAGSAAQAADTSSAANTTLKEADYYHQIFLNHTKNLVPPQPVGGGAISTGVEGTDALAAQVQAETVGPDSLATLPYPRLGFYAGMDSSGHPYIQNDGSIDPAPVNGYAKNNLLIEPATPITDGHREIIAALRAVNPRENIFAYTMASTTWCPQDSFGNNSYPSNYYYRHYYLAVNGGDPNCLTTSNRFLWLQDGSRADNTFGISANLAHFSGGRYDVAEDIAQVMYDDVVGDSQGTAPSRTGLWDGIFIDVYCNGILWMENPSAKIDYARAGYGNDNNLTVNNVLVNRVAFDAGWRNGYLALGNKLRQLVGPNFPLIGNCGQPDPGLYSSFNGWMREGFPFQNGATWDSNMYRNPGGYFIDEFHMRKPALGQLFTPIDNSGSPSLENPYTGNNIRKQRFGLGTASLASGFAPFNDGGTLTWAQPIPSYNWWFDEFGVDLKTGRSANGVQYMGWLGQPLGDVHQQIWIDPAQDIASSMNNGSFESDPIATNTWHVYTNSPAVATLSRDSTTAAVGSSSGKISVTGAGTNYGDISLGALTSFSATGPMYYITFWAKAATPTVMTVGLGGAVHYVLVTDEWKQYQMPLANPGNPNTHVYFIFDAGVNTYWLDDVHAQTFLTNIYRRDFDHGIVLVNPDGSTRSVTLEKPYKKILGTVDPTTNNGQVVTTLSVPPSDAVFLLDYDGTPPSAVSDLQAP